MFSVWTKHLKDKQERTKYEESLKHSKWVLTQLDEILKSMEEDLYSYETSIKQYDNANWSHKQADNNGFRRCLKAIRKLIDLDQREIINDRNTIDRRPT